MDHFIGNKLDSSVGTISSGTKLTFLGLMILGESNWTRFLRLNLSSETGGDVGVRKESLIGEGGDVGVRKE